MRQSARMVCVGAIIIALAAMAIAAGRGLYGDGSTYLVRILEHRTFFAFDPPRTYADHLTQAPVVLALKLGVRSMHSLILLHSFGLVALPVLAWLIALYKVRNGRVFWPFTLLFAVVYLNSGVMAIANSNLVYGLVACSLALLLKESPFSLSDGLLLLIISTALMRMYETMVFLGPLLCLLSVVRLRNDRRLGLGHEGGPISGLVASMSLAVAALLFLASAGIAAWSVTHFRDPSNLSNARDLSLLLKNRQALLSFAAGFAYALLILPRPHIAIVDAVCGLAAGAAIFALTLHSNRALPSQYSDVRAWVGVFQFGFAVLLAAPTLFLKGEEPRPPFMSIALAGIPLSLFLILGFFDMKQSRRFGEFVACFRNEVNSRTGLVRPADTMLHRAGCGPYGLGWGYAYPSLSILLRRDATRGIILSPLEGYQPFDPNVAVPDMSAYY